jgi:hypothetical protein
MRKLYKKLLELAGGKAYSSDEIREYLRSRHIRINIPPRIDETRTGKFDKIIYLSPTGPYESSALCSCGSNDYFAYII